MEEIMVKSHLIVKEVHDEFSINWCGRILDTKPEFKNNMPIFVIVGTGGRIELNTTDMPRVENAAKLLTRPKGRAAVTEDTARIYIKETNGNEKIMGTVTHRHIKEYATMYDKIYKR